MKKRLRTIDYGLWTFLLLVLSLWSLVHRPAFAAQSIADIQISGEILTPKDRILSVLPFKIGDPFDSKKIEEGVQYLKKWGIFDVVEAKSRPGSQGIVIEFNLHEAQVISEINIIGHYPYMEAKIRKRLNLEVGNMAVQEKIEEQKERIRSFYERLGYYNTQVSAKEEPAAANNSVNVTFHIIKGERLRYSHVDFEGVKAFQKGRMFSFIKALDLYSEKRLKNAVQKLVQFYRARGYLRAQVKVTDKKIDLEKRRVWVKLMIKEGPRVQVFFRGKKHYLLKTLKKTITLYQEGNFDPVSLQASEEALVKHLKKDGFREAKVTSKIEKINADLYRVFFYIEPGPKSSVGHIDFVGNESIPDDKLKKQLLTKEHSLTQKGILDPSLLNEDQKILTEFYQSKGFLDAAVQKAKVDINPDRTKLNIQFQVDEGLSSTIGKIVFQGNKEFPDKQLLKVLQNKEGTPFNEVILATDKEQILLFYANHGHPYAEVEQKLDFHGQDGKVNIFYDINEGPLVKIGEILIIGDVLTGVRPIRQAMGIKSGDLYSYQKVVEAGLNLRRLGAFNTVNVETIGLEEKETQVHLRVKVEERRPFVIDLSGQYSTDNQFSGTLKFTNFNSFGWAKQTGLLFTGGREKDRAEISWYDPRFIGADIQTTFSSWMDYEKKPIETSLQAGGAVAFFRQFHRFGFLSRYELTRNYIIKGEAIDPRSLRDSTLSQVSLSGSYDVRNSFSDPSKGFFVLVGSNIFNEIGGLEANFAKIKFGFSHYYSPFKRLTLSNTLRVDMIQNIISNAVVPQRQLLTLGGDDTLRGFSEDSLGPIGSTGKAIGGRTRWIYSSELHARLFKGFQGALFYDTGSLTDSFSNIHSDTVRQSVGFGLRYITPVGPIRADYGIILDRKPGEHFGRFHLTFGYPF